MPILTFVSAPISGAITRTMSGAWVAIASPLPDDVPLFLAAIALLILYLCWSAATEMGTQWPWKK